MAFLLPKNYLEGIMHDHWHTEVFLLSFQDTPQMPTFKGWGMHKQSVGARATVGLVLV